MYEQLNIAKSKNASAICAHLYMTVCIGKAKNLKRDASLVLLS